MQTLTLPVECDRSAAIALYPEICAQSAGQPVRIDGKQCRKIGLAMVQVLLSARRGNQQLKIEASRELRDAVEQCGLADQLLD